MTGGVTNIMARKNSIITVDTLDNGSLAFHVTGVGSFFLKVAALADDLKQKALIHGLVQKISDAAAIAKSELPDDATEAAKIKFEAMKSVADRLAEGDWSKRSGDGTAPVSGIIFRAFYQWAADMAKARKKPIPDETAIRAIYDAKDRAGQLALRSVPEIAAIIEQMKADKGTTSKVDASALLGELGL